LTDSLDVFIRREAEVNSWGIRNGVSRRVKEKMEGDTKLSQLLD
jgi:hypothetical protein